MEKLTFYHLVAFIEFRSDTCTVCQCFNFEGSEPSQRPHQDETLAKALGDSKLDSNIHWRGYRAGNENSFAIITRYYDFYYDLL